MRLINRARRRLARWIAPKVTFDLSSVLDRDSSHYPAVELKDVTPVVFPHYNHDDAA